MIPKPSLRLAATALALATLVASPSRAKMQADPSLFFDRLDSIGMDTEYLRNLATKVEFFYRDSTESTEASYGYILNNVYLPPDFREEGSNKIRFDLTAPQINTLIHELAHAANDVSASKKAPRGTTARHHHDLIHSIWADLYNDERHQFLGLPRYPRMKADEICGYFMGAAIGQVVENIETLILINTKMVRLTASTPEEALALGDRLVLPADSESAFVVRVRDQVFGEVAAGNSEAYFEGKEIPWDERKWVKRDMYRHVLGLRPPADAAEQLRRLNELDNDWIRKVRRQVREAREAWAKKRAKELEAAAAPDAGVGFGGLNRAGGGLFGID